MIDLSQIKKHALVIGADGVTVGTVERVHAGLIKLAKIDSSDDKHHTIKVSLIAEIEDGTVRLSANADVAVMMEHTENE